MVLMALHRCSGVVTGKNLIKLMDYAKEKQVRSLYYDCCSASELTRAFAIVVRHPGQSCFAPSRAAMKTDSCCNLALRDWIRPS